MDDWAMRRVVTGIDAQGRSCIAIDGPVVRFGEGGGGSVWRAPALPADNSGCADAAVAHFSYDQFHDGGSNFLVVTMQPGEASSVHATDTADYIVMMRGQVTLVLNEGETTLSAGDVLVDRGVVHQWRNDGAEPCLYAVITVPAHPVGSGRTM